MNYTKKEIEDLAQGIYPKGCAWGHGEPCFLDIGKPCNLSMKKEDCFSWVEYNNFDSEKLAQDIMELYSKLSTSEYLS